jgi:hypothetical protein
LEAGAHRKATNSMLENSRVTERSPCGFGFDSSRLRCTEDTEKQRQTRLSFAVFLSHYLR